MKGLGMVPQPGNTVLLRDGRTVYVTDAVDQEAPKVIENPDDICIGTVSSGIDSYTIVFPASEVVEVID